MKQIQKRYLYAGILSAIFFLVTYVILDFNIFLSIILTGAIYGGGIFLFKEKDIRALDAKNVNNYYFAASKCAHQAEISGDDTIKSIVDKITTYTDEIIVSLSQRPKKVEQVFDFFDYYLDITNKILMRYNAIKNNDKKTTKDREFSENADDYLLKISDCFEKQLSNMKEARMLDIESEIRIFEHAVGFKKTDIEVGETDENE